MTLGVINWLLAACFMLTAPTITLAQQVDKKVTEGGVIVDSLSGASGDPARGRLIVLSRQSGLCILCHSGPFPEERFQGNLAPDLAMSAACAWSVTSFAILYVSMMVWKSFALSYIPRWVRTPPLVFLRWRRKPADSSSNGRVTTATPPV